MKKMMSFLLCVMVAFSVCVSAAAGETQTDFLLFDGLTWSTAVEDYSGIFGTDPLVKDSAKTRTFRFNDLKVPSMDGSGFFEFCFYPDSAEPTMGMMALSVDRPRLPQKNDTSMQDAYDSLIREGDRIYDGRAKVLFSSVEEMAAAQENRKTQSQDISAFLNGLNGTINVFKDMYRTDEITCLTDARGWFLEEERFGAAVMYSGQKNTDNTIIMMYINMDAASKNIGTVLTQPDTTQTITPSRFGLPDGFGWKDGKQTLMTALGSKYAGTTGESIAAVFSGDAFTGGYTTVGEYTFRNDQLLAVRYAVVEADRAVYDDVVSMLMEDLGSSSADLATDSTLQSLKANNPTIEDGEMWYLQDSMLGCIYDPSGNTVVVLAIPWTSFQ